MWLMPPSREPDRTRRSVQAEQATMSAVWKLCKEVGYAKLTIDAIAARAGVSKATIYRWWPSKGAILLDAFLAQMIGPAPFPDTGDIRADLRTQMIGSVNTLGGPESWPHYSALIGEAQHHPDLAEAIYDRLIGPLEQAAAERLRAAQRQGQIGADLDPDRIIDLVYGALYYRKLLAREPADAQYIDKILTTAFNGLES